MVTSGYLILAAFTVQAAEFYVDNKAAAGGDGRSWHTAWKTFSNINWSSFKPGDNLYISGGPSGQTYRETLEIGASGSAGHYINISAGLETDHSGPVTIDGEAKRSSGIRVRARQYVRVSGLKLRGHKQSEVYISGKSGSSYSVAGAAKNLVIENLDILTAARGIFIQTSNQIRITSNIIKTVEYSASQTDGIYSQRNVDNIYENNRIIINNREKSGHDDGIQLFSDEDAILRFNYIEQNNDKISNAQGIYQEEGRGLSIYEGNIVFMNMARSNAIYFISSPGLGGRVNIIKNIVYLNNPNLDNRYQTGINIKGTSGSLVSHNVIYSSSLGRAVLINLRDGVKNNLIDWNLVYAPQSKTFLSLGQKNLSWKEWQAAGFDKQGLNVDPLFIDAKSGDLSFQSDSPAVRLGFPLNPKVLEPSGPGSGSPPLPLYANDTKLFAALKGQIILRVERNGEAYYLNPDTRQLHYLGSPEGAFRIMSSEGVGISNRDLQTIQIGNLSSVRPFIGRRTVKQPARYIGRIFLAVEQKGEAWYVSPVDGKRYFLGRPAEAFQIMQRFGLGISESNFFKLIS